MRTYLLPEGASAEQQNGHAEIIAVHAALLVTNKIVYFAGDQHDPGQFAHGLFDQARVFDCTTGRVDRCQPTPEITDLFCGGQALMPDGRVLIAGGTSRFDGFLGDPSAWIFDPAASSFTRTESMRDGRWYPTLVTLGDGGILAVSGINAGAKAPGGSEREDQNRDLEVFYDDHDETSWLLQGRLPDPTGTLYPRLHLLPDGKVIFITPVADRCATWRPGEPSPHPLCDHPLPRSDSGFAEYTSVLLPLLPENDYAASVLVGNLPHPKRLNLTASPLVWFDTGPRRIPTDGVHQTEAPPRVNGMMVLLPTGEVLACGGEAGFGDEDHPVHALEVYKPDTNSWETLPTRTQVTRGYHSVALLLPNGSVWLAGSNKRCDWSFHDSADFRDQPPPTSEQQLKRRDGTTVAVDNRELRIEIFEPWYVGHPARPSFSLEEGVLAAGGQLAITTARPDEVVRVALIRSGSTTHAFNCDQRYVALPFRVHDGTVIAELPANPHLLPPGPWLVFIIVRLPKDPDTAQDIPSEGKWIIIQQPSPARRMFHGLDARTAASSVDLTGVPIRPIDSELLERQRSMEGMHHGGMRH